MSRDDSSGDEIEIRERIATLEAHLQSHRENMESIDQKQDQILDTVQDIDTNTVTKDQFNENWREDIMKNSRMRWVLKAGATLGSVIAGMASFTVF